MERATGIGKERPRVLMGMDVYLPDVDGVVTCMDNYCRVLAEQAELTAAAPRNRRGYADNLPYNLIRCAAVYLPILRMYYGLPNSDRRFKRRIYSQDYDIIHFHSPFNIARFLLRLGRRRGVPTVATFHTNMRPIFKLILRSKWITERCMRAFGRLYNRCDEVFVCSPFVEQQLRSFGYTGRVSLMPFGTHFKRLTDTAAVKAAADLRYGLCADETVFLHVGRVVELKRIDFILDSLKLLKDRGKRFKFFICGKGNYTAKLKAYAAQLGLSSDEIIFTGFINEQEMTLLYTRADLFLFPSLYDNFGLVKVEAAAHSTPCVFVEASAAGYGVTDGVNGFLAADNTAAFAAKIEQAIADKETLNAVGKNAARDLYFSWEQCGEILLERYRDIIARCQQTPKPARIRGRTIRHWRRLSGEDAQWK